MKRLGISIYPEIVGVDPTIEYLDLAYKHGFRRVFANLLEITNSPAGKEKLATLAKVYKYAKKLGFEVIVDVNPLFYQEFKLAPTETTFFAKLGVTGIRLDEDFKGEVEAKLSHNSEKLKIELNASATSKIIDAALAHGGRAENFIACHNFYPMRYTGLALTRFMALSAHFKARNIRVAAFVTLPEKQKGIGPWNVNEGMPTLESHRDLPLTQQVQELLAFEVVDDIILSQQGATSEQLSAMGKVLKNYQNIMSQKEITIRIKLEPNVNQIEKQILFENKNRLHFNRPDFNEFFVRSTLPRLDYKNDIIKPFQAGKTLHYGDVVILNNNLGRYQGELHLMLQTLNDQVKARNLVGKVIEEDLFKLHFIYQDIKFKIIEAT